MPVFAAPVKETVGGVTVIKTVAAADAQTTAKQKAVYPNWWCWPITLLLVAAGALFGTMLYNGGPDVTFTPPTGVGIFALFYILAQVIERIIEPFSPYLGSTKAEVPEDSNRKEVVNQRDVRASLDLAMAAALADPNAKATAAATAQRNVDQVRANATVVAFGVASLLAMLGAGLLESLLLETVGVEGLGSDGENVIWVDIIVTGLAVGAGTKPLHDLISNIKESKEDKQDKKPGE